MQPFVLESKEPGLGGSFTRMIDLCLAESLSNRHLTRCGRMIHHSEYKKIYRLRSYLQNDDAKDQKAGQPNQTHAKVADPGRDGSQTGGGVHIVALRISANTLFYADAFCLIFSECRVAQMYNLL